MSLIDWCPFVIIGNTMPPRDPHRCGRCYNPRQCRERLHHRLGWSNDRRPVGRDAQLQLHPGFRTRRLSPARASAQQLTGRTRHACSRIRGSFLAGRDLGL
jgi:hypothetical protein